MMTSIFGYEFRNPALLEEALVTPACKMNEPTVTDNQRLEFLGDAVLGLLAADRLYSEMPDRREGSLTIMRTRMVSATALCAAAARLGLLPMLKRNKGAGPLSPNSKTVADAIEAIIGAAWLDGGLVAAKRVFDALELSPADAKERGVENPKGELQIRAQAMKPPRKPVYERLSVSGKAHEPVFTVRVKVEGMGNATASAHSVKEAQTLAAALLLEK